jgi:hypothetical protein
MKQVIRVGLLLVAVVGIPLAVVIGLVISSMRPPDYVFDNGRPLIENVSGRWDWSTATPPCADSAHTIAFSDGGKVMTITQQQQHVDSTGHDWTVSTYDVISTTPSRIRGVIRGETRLTDAGKPVVWDLVVVGPDAYQWQRTDRAVGYTPRVIRCGD